MNIKRQIMQFKLSKYTVITDLVDDNNRIIYSTRTGKVFVISSDTLNCIDANTLNLIHPGTLIRLMEAEVIVPAEENELDSILKDFKLFNKDVTSFGLTLQPSANCQLGCHYCGQSHAKYEINDETYHNIIEHVLDKLSDPKYQELSIMWYGAEPLMSITNIHRLSEEFKRICQQKGLRYVAAMITNGLSLKRNIYETLANDYKITDYQITLDGDRESHNNSRMTKKGLDTFDIIYNNIKECVNSPVYAATRSRFLIRCNVTKQNFSGIDDLFRKMAEDGIQDKISIELAPVHDWGGNNADEEGFTRQEFAEKEIEWLLLMKDLGFKLSPLIPMRRYNTCMVTSGDDAELIDAKGDITYCWEVTYTPKYENSGFIIGNVNKEEVYVPNRENAPLKNWYDLIGEGFSWCKGCTFLPVCGGACPVSWAKKEAPCPSFKYNMNDRLIMEYLINKKVKV
jgi:uncharacterized protein